MQKPIHKHKLLKSQIPSTKLQINLKLQYSMTKTGLECLILEIIHMFWILNFGHCDLFGIWYLWFGISPIKRDFRFAPTGLSASLWRIYPGWGGGVPILNLISSTTSSPIVSFILRIISSFKNWSWCIQTELFTSTRSSLPLNALGWAFCETDSPTIWFQISNTWGSCSSGLCRNVFITFGRISLRESNFLVFFLFDFMVPLMMWINLNFYVVKSNNRKDS